MPSRVVFAGIDLIDGTGAPARAADVVVDGDSITAVVPPGSGPLDGARVVDGALPDGRRATLTPGFIDMHAHSDLALVHDREHLAKVSQGVTTEVVGQDGIAYAPLVLGGSDVTSDVVRQIAAWNGTGDVAWRTVPEYLRAVDGAAVNAAFLVPQGNLRMLVVGQTDRPASPAEVAQMRELLAAGLDAGARGMSSGLTYTPGMYATADELAALAAVVAERGGYWAPHTRGYGGHALDAYREVLDVGRRTGCPIHLTHATMNYPPNRGRAAELLALVDAALADGVDVTLDTYPYTPGATTLAALLPSWAAAGGPDATLARLRDTTPSGPRAAILDALDVTGSDGNHGEVVDWAGIQVSGVTTASLAGAVGLTIAELASRRGLPPSTAALELMVADGLGTGILMHVGDEDNVRAVMRHPRHCGGSDAILVGARPHPRAWGTFPRFLGHYARDLGVLSMPEMVRHLTSNPAARLGLTDRGVVAPGMRADLVLLDADAVLDGATFDAPRTPAVGISHVMVNGEFVLDDGVRTSATPGRVLRSRG
ncbi:Amidohydrolase 3 [Beutenbergia cavernae DSM 12333]|uniref:Amidohydrolase 3 n=1 Tax=Beutenbergia cavernae (strain ATCC BAA-8 / DSM 12333 / CCUG 43141 / JCM 11478 / NBRC 16432 / NCIMB 13614 / HKI 0122) TaxID=471853 RepID=C5BUW1_BEUC1|nr:amidohydrolase family protein [Beutenbergia cavernae]ACQ78335.1 Amidohydrolase 3 [Beutenbergia cavernae DSM 12333]